MYDGLLDADVDLDAHTAAAVARGMRTVAAADGHIHPREVELIALFEAQIPEEADHNRAMDPAIARQVFLRSLIMVALADGHVSDAERVAIAELAQDHDITAEEIEEEILVVKRSFLKVFAGVQVFKSSVVRVARELGLPDSEVDALSGEA